MDQVMVDCGNAPVAVGDEVVFFGTGEGGAPTAAEWALKLGTIHYEVVAGMVRPRVTRTVLGKREFAAAAGSHQTARVRAAR